MEQNYLNLLSHILDEGEERSDRTGVGTLSVFATQQLSFDLSLGFPLLTTKKMSFRQIAAELLWFIEGSSDERRLAEITHGSRDPTRSTIWTANAAADYWKGGKFPGDLGRVYGVQWRRWRHNQVIDHRDEIEHGGGDKTYLGAKVVQTEHDQLSRVIETLKTNPHDRRMLITALNVGELDQMALPPCHLLMQFYASKKTGKLSCQVYQRSVDTLLGLPYNIASYATLVHMIAQVTSFEPGTLSFSLGDTHIYLNHVEAVKQQLSRTPRVLPMLELDKDVRSIDDFKLDSFKLLGYDPYPPISAKMAV